MEYRVTRTSQWNEDKPCEEAYQKQIIYTDERNIPDPMENLLIGKSWYTDKGWFNHRVENGHIKRDKYVDVWMIEIKDQEELLKFIDKYGDIVIQKDESYHSYEIEIYDGWRE